MGKIGLIAGGGFLPIEFVRAVKNKGDEVIVFAIKDMASPEIEKEASKVYWIKFGQFAKILFLLIKEHIKHIALLGKIKKARMYTNEFDKKSKHILKKAEDGNDYSILKGVTKYLGKVGIVVIEPTEYLSHLIPERGVMGRNIPEDGIKEDMVFGYDMAKVLAGVDIGQAVAVKGKTIVAVEALEGTDDVIKRANKLAGAGCVLVKVSRPDQDMRWDIPVVGPTTMAELVKNGFRAVAIESGKMFIVKQDEFVKLAEENDIAVEAL